MLKYFESTSTGACPQSSSSIIFAKIIELEDCGHAPVLVDSKYLSIVSEWLSETNHLIEDEDLPPQDKELGKDQVD